jgi:hypothetical protein
MDETPQPAQPLPRKVRGDSKWNLLTPGQQQALRDMESRNIPRSKQLLYFREKTGETWTASGIGDFWQSEREHEKAVLDGIARTRAVAKEILDEDRKTGVGLEEATAKKLLSIWTLIADARANLTTPEGIGLLVMATDAIAALSKGPLKKAELAERKESRQQRERDSVRKFMGKVEAGLQQIMTDVAGNPEAAAIAKKLGEVVKKAKAGNE